MAKDFLVEVGNPEAFDRTVQMLGAALIDMGPGRPGEYKQVDGYYVMRVLGDPGFVRFAVEHQGYGKIIRELPALQ